LDLKKFTDANRKAWDMVTPYHQRAKAGKFFEAFKQTGYSTLDDTITARINKIGLAGRRVVQIACNDGREVLSLKNLGAAEVVGIDISEAAISEARKLSAETGVEAEFICSDIYDLNTTNIERFDLCYISIGCLGWMPDLDRFFDIISRLLLPDGELLIYETHPFVEMLDPEGESTELKLHESYFRQEPFADESGFDYWGNVKYHGVLNYWFPHKLSETFMAMINNGFRILSFAEYPHDISNVYGKYRNDRIKIPLCMIVHARKLDQNSA
jgi:SAM-dependent methyltransferase